VNGSRAAFEGFALDVVLVGAASPSFEGEVPDVGVVLSFEGDVSVVGVVGVVGVAGVVGVVLGVVGVVVVGGFWP
jgi:hypothetical protein